MLSEYPLATPVDTYRLIARDRLQAALSAELLVIECGAKSGTMHTARSSHSLPAPTASPHWREIGSSSNLGALSPGKSALYTERNFRICAEKFPYIRK